MDSDDDNVKYRLTPKGFLALKLMAYGVEAEDVDNLWHMLEAFCLKIIKDEYPEAEYPAIMFDGNGGIVIGIDQVCNDQHL